MYLTLNPLRLHIWVDPLRGCTCTSYKVNLFLQSLHVTHQQNSCLCSHRIGKLGHVFLVLTHFLNSCVVSQLPSTSIVLKLYLYATQNNCNIIYYEENALASSTLTHEHESRTQVRKRSEMKLKRDLPRAGMPGFNLPVHRFRDQHSTQLRLWSATLRIRPLTAFGAPNVAEKDRKYEKRSE